PSPICCLTAAGRLPSWKAFSCETRSSFGCPASAGTSLVVLRPSVPWQLAQVAARLRATALSWALAANAAHVSTAPSAILGIIWAPPSCNPKIKGSGDGRGFFLELQLDLLVVADVDGYSAAVLEPPEQQLVGQRSPDRVLDEPRHGPRTHQRIEALLRQVLLQALAELRLDLLLRKLLVELHQELVDHPHDDFVVERTERDDRVQAVAELGGEHPLDRLHLVARLHGGCKSHLGLRQRLGTRVRGHDDALVAEVRLPAVVVGQPPVG